MNKNFKSEDKKPSTKHKKSSKTFPLGRNAETGKFVSAEEARRHPKTSIVERISKAGCGDDKSRPRPPRKHE